MSIKISKEDAKNPDLVTQELKKGFEWSAKHLNLIVGFTVAFIAIGGAYSLIGQQSKKKELTVQEKYFEFEKMYLEKKQKFESAETQKETNKTPSSEDNKASGDLIKDYGPVVEGFKNVVNSAPASKGAKMAALQLSEIHAKYKNPEQALETLKKVDSNSNDFLSSLVKIQLGNFLAEKKDCESAIKTWDEVLVSKEAEFLHSSIKLKKGLCYEILNDKAKAQENYSQVLSGGKSEDKDSAITKSAEKYLRLLKSKKTE